MDPSSCAPIRLSNDFKRRKRFPLNRKPITGTGSGPGSMVALPYCRNYGPLAAYIFRTIRPRNELAGNNVTIATSPYALVLLSFPNRPTHSPKVVQDIGVDGRLDRFRWIAHKRALVHRACTCMCLFSKQNTPFLSPALNHPLLQGAGVSSPPPSVSYHPLSSMKCSIVPVHEYRVVGVVLVVSHDFLSNKRERERM